MSETYNPLIGQSTDRSGPGRNPGQQLTRLHVVHTTGFRYAGVVSTSYNEARMTPRTTPRQRVLDEFITVSPSTWRHRYLDYWRTEVTAFEVVTPHRELSVVSTCVVEVMPFGGDDDAARQVGWDVVRSPRQQDTLHEYLEQTDYTRPPQEVTELAREAVGDRGPHDAALAICAALTEPMTYEGGVTSVQTPATEVWAAQRGVCQDFAHLSLGALRAVGIPARYVSGYLHPQRDAEVGQTVAGQTHAWVEWWTGQWYAFDPTHSGPVAGDHVCVASGRDYHDVPPLKGVYGGADTSELFVTVEVTRQQ